MLNEIKKLLKSSDRTKFLKTIVLFLTFASLGCQLSLVGPTLLDLQQQVDASLEQITLILPARAGGYALGAIASKNVNLS